MSKSFLFNELLTLSVTAALTVLLLWMTILLKGTDMLIIAACAWAVLIVVFRRKWVRNNRLFFEYGTIAALLGAQVSLIVAIVMQVGPSFVY